MFNDLANQPPELGGATHGAFTPLIIPHTPPLIGVGESWRDLSDDDLAAHVDALNVVQAPGWMGLDMAVAVDAARRRIAARKDAAMLGDSGYERIEADFYPTPQENVDCLMEHILPNGKVWEPACGKGDIALRLEDYGHETYSTDLFDQGYGVHGLDFLAQTKMPEGCRSIYTNPPYADGLAEKFVRHALKLTMATRGQVAMFLRNEFDCGKGRMDLFSNPPFHKKIVVTKRPRWIEGSTGSPRHNYSWFVWDWRHKSGHAGVAYSHPDFAPSPATTLQ